MFESRLRSIKGVIMGLYFRLPCVSRRGYRFFRSMNIEPGKTAGRLGKLLPNPKAKLRDQFHEVCRFKYFSQRTEDSYWQWVVRFLRFHRDHPPLIKPDSHPSEGAQREQRWRHPR